MFPKISSHEIERWATGHPSAPALLPELLRRLVWSQPLPLTQVDFPAGRETQRPGYDGTVYLDTHPLSRVSAFIPNGASVWELSVDQRPAPKAQRDYDKRSAQPAPADPTQTTYVVVTAQRWPGCKKWAAERSAEGIWREVRAYDADSLDQWLESAPAVGVWFARQLGGRPEHFHDALGYLRRWQEMVPGFPLPQHAGAEGEAMPPMSSLLLAGRADEAQRVRRWALDDAAPLRIHAERRDEAIAFVCAALASPRWIPAADEEAAEPTRAQILSRLLVVSDDAAMDEALLQRSQDLILLPDLAETPRPSARGAHMLVVTAAPERADVRLEPQRSQDLARILLQIGVPLDRANQLAFASRGLHALRRALGMEERPEWADNHALVPALLLGQWTSSEADWSTLARLSERDAASLEREVLHPYTIGHEPPLELETTRRNESYWRWRSRPDAWGLLKGFISESHLRAFGEIAINVLCEDNQYAGLTLEEMWKVKQEPRCSDLLREGIAEGLAMLVTTPPERLAKTVQIKVDGWVYQILEGADLKRWASLDKLLPVLAQASPKEFLRAVGEALSDAETSPLRRLVERSNHTSGLLRGLELIGSSSDVQVTRDVVGLLCKLQGLVVWSDRSHAQPWRVVSDLFHPVWPRSALELDGRLKMMNGCSEEVGWRTRLAWLGAPSSTAVGQPHRSTFRGWGRANGEVASNDGIWRAQRDAGTKLIEAAKHEPERWLELLMESMLRNLIALELTNELAEALAANAAQIRASESYEKIIRRLRESLHCLLRPYMRAVTTPTEDHKRLLAVYEGALAPGRWLELCWLLEYGVLRDPRSGEERFDQHEERIDDALRALFDERGLDGWQQLLNDVKESTRGESVAGALARVVSAEQLRTILRTFTPPAGREQRFWWTLLYQHARREPPTFDWVMSLMQEGADWPETQRAFIEEAVIRCLPLTRGTLDYLNAPGHEALRSIYQRSADVWITDEIPADVAFEAFDLWIEQRRGELCRMLGFSKSRLKRLMEQHPARLAGVVQRVLFDDDATRELDADGMSGLQGAHDLLIELGGYDVEQLARFELEMFGWLQEKNTPAVYELMVRSPAFFIELLTLANQRSRSEDTRTRQLADSAYYILSDDTPPTFAELSGLSVWVDEVLKLAEGQARGRRAAHEIGAQLAKLPADGELWPARQVCEVLERGGEYAEVIRGGFSSGAFNKRGGYIKRSMEGGEQERAIADQYRGFAAMWEDEFYDASLVLREIAASFEAWARREDSDAELMRREHHMYYHAGDQQGVFSIKQAEEDGFAGLIPVWMERGMLREVQPGVYEVTQVDVSALQGNGATDQVEQARIALWLWSRQEGVFSHETALALHDLSDVNPAKLHMTLPLARQGRMRSPDEALVLHFAEIGADERQWFGGIPATHAARTVNDCAGAAVLPDLVRQAVEQGLERGLFREAEIKPALAYLAQFEVGRGEARRRTR